MYKQTFRFACLIVMGIRTVLFCKTVSQCDCNSILFELINSVINENRQAMLIHVYSQVLNYQALLSCP